MTPEPIARTIQEHADWLAARVDGLRITPLDGGWCVGWMEGADVKAKLRPTIKQALAAAAQDVRVAELGERGRGPGA